MESFSRRKTDKKIAKALGSTPRALKKEQKDRDKLFTKPYKPEDYKIVIN